MIKSKYKPVYISSTKIERNERGQEYIVVGKPVLYSFNLQNTNTDVTSVDYGTRLSKNYYTYVSNIYENKIKEGDIAFLNGVVPNEKLDNYNYRITEVRPQYQMIAIYFERIQKNGRS